MKKLLTIILYSFIIFSLTSCGKDTEIKNTSTIQSGPTQQDGLITTPGVEKKSYSNGFTQ